LLVDSILALQSGDNGDRLAHLQNSGRAGTEFRMRTLSQTQKGQLMRGNSWPTARRLSRSGRADDPFAEPWPFAPAGGGVSQRSQEFQDELDVIRQAIRRLDDIASTHVRKDSAAE